MINQFGIHLKVRNFDNSYQFYRRFGFKPVFAYGNISFLSKLEKQIPRVTEIYNGVTFQIGNALFEIADGHMAVKKKVFKKSINNSKISAMIQVSSLKSVINVCNKYNYPIAIPPIAYPWGTQELVIKDPDGFVLVFIEKIKKNQTGKL